MSNSRKDMLNLSFRQCCDRICKIKCTIHAHRGYWGSLECLEIEFPLIKSLY